MKKNVDSAYNICYIFHIEKRDGYTVRFPQSLFLFSSIISKVFIKFI